jgi:phosphatidylglycerophosphate synthase
MAQSPTGGRSRAATPAGPGRSARRLAIAAITPNQISMASMGAAAPAPAPPSGSRAGTGPRIALLLVAALFCQLRLLCNLFDGMVAIEGGKQSADGPFWNEFPDRIADILILAGVGYGDRCAGARLGGRRLSRC